VARTVAIDDVVRETASPELVILGAGLDGRAFRMPELARTIVFVAELRFPSKSEQQARDGVAGLLFGSRLRAQAAGWGSGSG
jgi:Leucine carboxyl methyltransferase